MATMRARNEGFRRWLEKSGSLPLTISLATEDHHRYLPIGTRPTITPDDPKLQGLRAELVNTLARYCQQWRIMAFDEATHSVVASAFGRLTTKDLPLLETVHSNGNVFLWQERDTDDIKPIRLSVIGSLLGRASSLRALQLTRGYFSERSLLSDLPLSWSRLTELSITPPPGHYFDCYILLQLLAKECHSLATLDLDSPTVYFDPEHLGERRLSPVEWPSIRKFVISFNGPLLEHLPVPVFPRPVVEVFESVNLPSLKEFAVDLVGYHNLSSPSCAISLTPWELLLSRSQPAVTHIQLAFPAFLDAKAVIRSLQPLDTLKSLRFGRGDEAWKVHDQALLSAFLEAGTSLCPELEEVEFSACGSETAKTLLELAVRRPSIRVIRARFFLLEDEVETLLPSEQVVRELKMSTSGREGSLQGYIEDVRLIWTWRSHDDLSRDEHNDGMPASSRYHWYDG
ncbi:hypothetical protein V5O48_011240 [Marasmius crinis-equi]|uniref:Uncharacterized protein n=1 Tax=Marasmius crinis-equi TaxID=585013 RepID=A0ABR3F6A6_9AGAR